MPAESHDYAKEIQKLKAALAKERAEKKLLATRREEIKAQLQEALDGNKSLIALLQDLQAKLDKLIFQTQKRNRKEFGKQNEHHNPSPAPTSEISNLNKPEEPIAPETIKQKPKTERNHKKHAHGDENLPLSQVPHNVAADKLCCPACAIDTVFVKNELTYQLERIAISIEKLEHQQEVRACPKCKNYIVTAEKPCQPLPGARCGPRLLASVIVHKLSDGLPNYRQCKIFRRDQATIPRSTQCDWIIASSLTLEPLYEIFKREVFKSHVIKTDDTEIKIQDRKHKNKIRKGKMTPYVGDIEHPYTIFDFSPTKSFARNIQMLQDFSGFVQCDAAGGFDELFRDGTKTEVGCNTHARRRYFDAQPLAVADCQQILDIYAALYDIEQEIKGKKADEILRVRQTKAQKLFDQLKAKIAGLKNLLTPSHPLMDAIKYTVNHWDALTRYLNDPQLSICNNAAERSIKEFVLCRKNFLFVGSDAGGRAAAIHLSFIASCNRNNIDPVAYLADVLSRINQMKTSELEQLLPDRWRPQELSP
jgi:transposase